MSIYLFILNPFYFDLMYSTINCYAYDMSSKRGTYLQRREVLLQRLLQLKEVLWGNVLERYTTHDLYSPELSLPSRGATWTSLLSNA